AGTCSHASIGGGPPFEDGQGRQVSAYEVRDELHLWWLNKPKAPALVGTLRLVRALQGVSLQYAPAWIEAGVPLSEDLPLVEQEVLPAQREMAVGAVDDA